jgi:hypothetical protein
MSKDENPLPRTDLPEFTEEEQEEISARPRDKRGRIPVTLEEVLRFPRGSCTNWRYVPPEEEQRAKELSHQEKADQLAREMVESIKKNPNVH